MKSIFLFCSLISATALFTGCGDSKQGTGAPSVSNQSLQGTWVMTSVKNLKDGTRTNVSPEDGTISVKYNGQDIKSPSQVLLFLAFKGNSVRIASFSNDSKSIGFDMTMDYSLKGNVFVPGSFSSSTTNNESSLTFIDANSFKMNTVGSDTESYFSRTDEGAIERGKLRIMSAPKVDDSSSHPVATNSPQPSPSPTATPQSISTNGNDANVVPMLKSDLELHGVVDMVTKKIAFSESMSQTGNISCIASRSALAIAYRDSVSGAFLTLGFNAKESTAFAGDFSAKYFTSPLIFSETKSLLPIYKSHQLSALENEKILASSATICDVGVARSKNVITGHFDCRSAIGVSAKTGRNYPVSMSGQFRCQGTQLE